MGFELRRKGRSRTTIEGDERTCTRNVLPTVGLSSMMTRVCRWGWRDSDPAQWTEPPSTPSSAQVVPTPVGCRWLHDDNLDEVFERMKGVAVAGVEGQAGRQCGGCDEQVDSSRATRLASGGGHG